MCCNMIHLNPCNEIEVNRFIKWKRKKKKDKMSAYQKVCRVGNSGFCRNLQILKWKHDLPQV